jgi:hypothetical protein
MSRIERFTKSKFHSKICNKVSLKVLDGFHVLSLLGLLGTALWNLTLTVKDKASIQNMRPVFIATLIAALLKIPSQICAVNTRGSVLTLIGSLVSIIITTILLMYLYLDPVYANTKTEDVCLSTKDDPSKKYCLALGTEKFVGKECPNNTCSSTGELGSGDTRWAPSLHFF